MSEKTWETLDEAQQTAVSDSLAQAALDAVNRAESEDNEFLAKLTEEGIKVHEFSGETAQKFVDDMRASAWPALEDRFGADLVSCLKSDIE